MAKTTSEEVQILHFFETAQIDKAEAVFNILSDKMRERLRGRAGSDQPGADSSGRRKRRVRPELGTTEANDSMLST